ncbi:MAG: hypothetical protein ACX93T_03510 [Bacteroidota bacterium]
MRRFPFLLACLSIVFNVLGQQSDTEGGLKDAEFIIKKERKPLLSVAPRLFEHAPTAPLMVEAEKPLVHTFPDLYPKFDALSFKTRLLRAKQGVIAKHYSNYLQGGHGNFYMPFLEGAFAGTYHKKYAYRLQVRHLSAGTENYAQEVHNLVQLYGKLFTRSLRLEHEIAYKNDKYPLYNTEQAKAVVPVSQVMHQVLIRNTLANYAVTTLQYQVDTTFHYLCSAYQVYEHQGEISGQGIYAFNDILKLKALTDLYLIQQSDTKVTQRNLWRCKLMLSLLYNDFDVEGGGNIAYQNDACYASSPVNIYPILAVKYVRYKWLQPYVSIGGDMQRNDLKGFLQENSLLTAQPSVRHTNQRFVFNGGIRGNMVAQISWHAGFSVGMYKNLHCLVNSHQAPGKFDIKYDPSAIMRNVFCAFNHTNSTETFSVQLRGDVFDYVLQELSKPWHRPRYQLDLLSTYRLNDKYIFKCNMCWIGGMVAWDAVKETSVPLKDVLETSLGIDYSLNTRLTAFCRLHNLLGRENARHLHYPARGFQCMAGISYVW